LRGGQKRSEGWSTEPMLGLHFRINMNYETKLVVSSILQLGEIFRKLLKFV